MKTKWQKVAGSLKAQKPENLFYILPVALLTVAGGWPTVAQGFVGVAIAFWICISIWGDRKSGVLRRILIVATLLVAFYSGQDFAQGLKFWFAAKQFALVAIYLL